MPRNPSHDKARKPQNLTREERIARVEGGGHGKQMMAVKGVPKKELSTSKLFPEGDTTIEDSLGLLKHGWGITRKYGRPLSYESAEVLEGEIIEFIGYCGDRQLAPTQVGLSLWLGIDEDTFYTWKGDSAHPFSESLKKATKMFQKFAEEKAMSGQMNPLIYFFQSKNYWGMRDNQEVTLHNGNTQQLSAQEQKEIIESLPQLPEDSSK